MATYNRPGVFVEETLKPLVDPNSNSSDFVAAFVGTSSAGGPVGPVLLTSWSQYQSLYGNIRQTQNDDLGYAVFSFFSNGGSRAYVCRSIKAGATSASLALLDTDPDGAGPGVAEAVATVTAKSPGVWASDAASNARVFVTVTPGSLGRFDLGIDVGSGPGLLARETFLDLTLDPTDDRNAVTIVNSPTVGSKYVTLSLTATGAFGVDFINPTAVAAAPLAGGSDGTGAVDHQTAVERLSAISANVTVNLPGVTSSAVLTDVIDWAQGTGNVFVVVDAPKPSPTDTPATVSSAALALAAALPAVSQVAVYAPWLYIQDPASGTTGALRLTAPGGAVLGQFARSDATRSVAKAPAGTGTTLGGVVQVATLFDSAALDSLNLAGVNVIRPVPGAGLCIMGARTLAKGMPDRYINVRRTLLYFTRELTNLTNFAIFETNDSVLWSHINTILGQYLTSQFQAGLLSGSSVNEAFYVKCDADNNDQVSINAGIVNIEVGLAVHSPAEFIVIQIGLFDGTAVVTDSTGI